MLLAMQHPDAGDPNSKEICMIIAALRGIRISIDEVSSLYKASSNRSNPPVQTEVAYHVHDVC